MRWPHNIGGRVCLVIGLLCAAAAGPLCAGPTPAKAPVAAPTVKPAPAAIKHAAPTPAKPIPANPAILPDYGGRDSGPVVVGESAPNPLAQAGRALVALLLVLAGVVGAVYGLKRFGLVTSGTDGKPSRISFSAGLGRGIVSPSAATTPITVQSSQPLPGGAMLHVVTVAGRTLLLGATGHTVTALSEWPADGKRPEDGPAFEDYLARADAAPPSAIAAANARLRSLLSRPEDTTL